MNMSRCPPHQHLTQKMMGREWWKFRWIPSLLLMQWKRSLREPDFHQSNLQGSLSLLQSQNWSHHLPCKINVKVMNDLNDVADQPGLWTAESVLTSCQLGECSSKLEFATSFCAFIQHWYLDDGIGYVPLGCVGLHIKLVKHRRMCSFHLLQSSFKTWIIFLMDLVVSSNWYFMICGVVWRWPFGQLCKL